MASTITTTSPAALARDRPVDLYAVLRNHGSRSSDMCPTPGKVLIELALAVQRCTRSL